ncbi:MAG: GNAT family N-acetyltransferase, partial [Hyphomicrobiales bacterium]
YATEACSRLLKFAFEETPLQDVVAVTDPGNATSRKVLKKSGMNYEGMRRAYAEQCPGYRITRAQWHDLTG